MKGVSHQYTLIQKGRREKTRTRRAYLVSFVINIFLPPLKLLFGFYGNSSALIADGINSVTDFLSNLFVYFSLRISEKPRDDNHSYGHGKYETVATFLLSIVMMVVALLIVLKALQVLVRFITTDTLPPRPDWYVIIVALFTVVVKLCAYYYTKRKARETRSEVLKAVALDHQADVASASAVLLGVAGAIFIGGWALLLEPIAAIVVAVFIFRMAYAIYSPCLAKLTEASVAPAIEAEIIEIANGVHMVQDAHNLRTRMVGSDRMAIELDVRIDGKKSLLEVHKLVHEIVLRLQKRYGQDTHVIIHPEPIEELEVEGKDSDSI